MAKRRLPEDPQAAYLLGMQHGAQVGVMLCEEGSKDAGMRLIRGDQALATMAVSLRAAMSETMRDAAAAGLPVPPAG